VGYAAWTARVSKHSSKEAHTMNHATDRSDIFLRMQRGNTCMCCHPNKKEHHTPNVRPNRHTAPRTLFAVMTSSPSYSLSLSQRSGKTPPSAGLRSNTMRSPSGSDLRGLGRPFLRKEAGARQPVSNIFLRRAMNTYTSIGMKKFSSTKINAELQLIKSCSREPEKNASHTSYGRNVREFGAAGVTPA
jgi:hypothetical protein